jgi:hypothetical protein
MLSLIESISKTKLKIFLSESYSLELLFRIERNKEAFGKEEIYESIISFKPKKGSFDRYINRLISENHVILKVASDKRKRVMVLTDDSQQLFDELNEYWIK